MTITFNQEDLPQNCLSLGHYLIVVSPLIGNMWLNVLFDGGNSLNILHAKVLNALWYPHASIKPVHNAFFCITPGMAVMPVGQVLLAFTIITEDNFWIEKIMFDIVNFKMAYNAILGHSVLVKFRGISHYAYNLLKMLRSRAIITIYVCTKLEVQCNKTKDLT